MAVNEPLVLMRVRMGLAGRILRGMLVMFIVHMTMLVDHYAIPTTDSGHICIANSAEFDGRWPLLESD